MKGWMGRTAPAPSWLIRGRGKRFVGEGWDFRSTDVCAAPPCTNAVTDANVRGGKFCSARCNHRAYVREVYAWRRSHGLVASTGSKPRSKARGGKCCERWWVVQHECRPRVSTGKRKPSGRPPRCCPYHWQRDHVCQAAP